MRTRRLWVSVIVVGVLVAGAIGSWIAGIRPVLGLDLEGGVSVILSAPDGTPPEVMDRALENIRRRIDAFGTAEPQLFVSGTSIEVQIPGLARGTIEERAITRSCLRDAEGATWGCFDSESAATAALASTAVEASVPQVCLRGDIWGDQPPCFPDAGTAQEALDAIVVRVRPGSASSTGGTATSTSHCLTGTLLAQEPCFATSAEADAAVAGLGLAEPLEEFCLRRDGAIVKPEGAVACFSSRVQAESALAVLHAVTETREFCVLSSAGRDLGCSPSREDAEAKLQATGQERLLEVIGTTARLEQREVLALFAPGDPSFDATPLTCGTEAERSSASCRPESLAGQEVVYPGEGADPAKYRLGPVALEGDAIRRATPVYAAGGVANAATGWQIDFELTSAGSRTFGDLTERLVGRQLAIVVDGVVISAPTVQSAITGGSGVITGAFTEQQARDLATQLNAGALPVALTTEQVLTVSPTLGKESLDQGLLAAIAGLVALALYLLFYYRLLGVVAWLGMSIWALLAIALVSLAGSVIGYSLTLAGVAGLVISLGVTADSYIVFFERLKDEVRGGRTPRAAVQPAFKRAYRTIVAADVVTGLAAIVLYVTAISSVRGFALTLGVATLLDLFVVYFFKRPTVFLIARSERLVNLRGFGLTSGVAAEPLAGERP